MDQLEAGYLLEQVFDRQHRRWRELRGGGFASSQFLRRLRGGREVEAIVALQHERADPATLRCHGPIVCAWRLNHYGLCEVHLGGFDPEAWPETTWPFALVRFALHDGDTPQVVLNELSSPTRGELLRCRVVRTPRGLSLGVLERRKHRAPAAATAASPASLTAASALQFLRGNDRTMPAGA